MSAAALSFVRRLAAGVGGAAPGGAADADARRRFEAAVATLPRGKLRAALEADVDRWLAELQSARADAGAVDARARPLAAALAEGGAAAAPVVAPEDPLVAAALWHARGRAPGAAAAAAAEACGAAVAAAADPAQAERVCRLVVADDAALAVQAALAAGPGSFVDGLVADLAGRGDAEPLGPLAALQLALVARRASEAAEARGEAVPAVLLAAVSLPLPLQLTTWLAEAGVEGALTSMDAAELEGVVVEFAGSAGSLDGGGGGDDGAAMFVIEGGLRGVGAAERDELAAALEAISPGSDFGSGSGSDESSGEASDASDASGASGGEEEDEDEDEEEPQETPAKRPRRRR